MCRQCTTAAPLELPSLSICPRLKHLELHSWSRAKLPRTLGTLYKVDPVQVIQSHPYLIYLHVSQTTGPIGSRRRAITISFMFIIQRLRPKTTALEWLVFKWTRTTTLFSETCMFYLQLLIYCLELRLPVLPNRLLFILVKKPVLAYVETIYNCRASCIF